MRVTGDSDPGELGIVASMAPIPVEIQYGATASSPELLAAQERVHSALPDELRDATSELDVRRGELHIQLPSGAEPLSADLMDELERVARVPTRADVGRTALELDHTYGGRQLGNCTAGFTVRNTAGTTGVITNGHCLNSVTYYGIGESYPATFISPQQTDAYRDLQWHTTSHVEYRKFYANGSLRTVVGTVSRTWQDVGYWVCHQGMASGYSCGNIESVTFKPAWGYCEPNCASTWIKVSGSSLLCTGGDSGGPWFNGGYAYGVHTGSAGGENPDECDYSVYWAINYLSLGLTVLTG